MANIADVRVGIIGAGAIGGALIDRLLDSGSVRSADIVACERNEARREEIGSRFGVTLTADPAEAAGCDIIVLAAPPLEIGKILQTIGARLAHRPIVISFAGAVPLSLLEAALPSGVPVIRVNPNSPSIVGAGYNPVVYGSRTTGAARDVADQFLALLGHSPVALDAEMNLYTALTAVGPTYFLPIFDAMITAGIAGGLSREAAVTAAVETARGSAEMVATRSETPEQLKLFTGLRPLQDAAVRELISKAIGDALSRMEAVQQQAVSQAHY
jgi:pyrroline-5-carboxylate reductase